MLRDGLALRDGDDERLEEGDEYVALDFDVPTRTDGDEEASEDDRLWPA